MQALLIAEKPSLMREIQAVYNRHKDKFPFQIDFMAQAGHLFTLRLPKEIDAEKYGKWVLDDYPTLFPFQYKVGNNKENLVNDISAAIHSGKYDFIIHAGDPDGEGQLLVDEVLMILKNKLPVKRFWSNDLTEGGILLALSNIQDNNNYRPIRDAALIRQHEDYQFGMNTTAIATLKMNELCPLGRVKAIIVKLIAQREIEIENYVETKTYKPSFLYEGLEFVLDQAFRTKEEVLNNPPKANRALIEEYSDKVMSVNPPKLFKLSSLQVYCSKALHWSGSQTLKVLQTLYETKAVSYPRTDCEYLASGTNIGMIKNAVLKMNLFPIDPALLVRDEEQVRADKNYCNDKAIASEGHTAIIPTGSPLAPNATDEEYKLYEIICRQFLSSFGAPKKVRKIKANAKCDNYDQPYVYTQSSDVDPGFEYILDPHYEVKRSPAVSFTKGDTISPIIFQAKECVSTPPRRYNDGLLIQVLDNPEAFVSEDGEKISRKIGTPATRAPIIDACIQNGYINKKGTTFYATDKAKTILGMFGHIPLFDITESGQWEYYFEKIRHSEISPKEVEDYLNNKCISSTNSMKQVAGRQKPGRKIMGKCPHCGADVSDGKFGPYCTEKCGMTFGKAYGKVLTPKQIEDLLNGKKIHVKGFTSKKGTTYDASLIPVGVSEYSYNGKTGYSFKFEMEFDSKK